MRRVSVDDGQSWFDAEAAEVFEAKVEYDGSNWVSVATSDMWTSETLYRTASGIWIKNRYSSASGEDVYQTIDDDAAHAWLVRVGRPEDVPADDLAAMEV